jgi:Rap guanine nucleotide exchange factor 4
LRRKQTNHVVAKEQPFKDKVFLYRFRLDEDGSGTMPTTDDVNSANDHIKEGLTSLLHRGPDATLRLILRKP